MRQTRDPYRTWIAEVILQQTRMDQGLPYLQKFLEAFPDVLSLASASEDEVLRLWQGLGYYSRARNLHASARYVRDQLGGHMPASFSELLKLKGVGKYTAAAIASWCYGEPVAAVDGNVARVIARMFGITEAINVPAGQGQIEELAMALLDENDPGRHNQAMIEFGAMQCIPRSPSCHQCPLAVHCHARQKDLVDQLPVKQKNKTPSERWFYYYVIRSGGKTILVQRGGKDIWEGLYEPPMIETPGPRTDEEIIRHQLPQVLKRLMPSSEPQPFSGSQPSSGSQQSSELQEGDRAYTSGNTLIGELSLPIRHQLSHQTIHARFLPVEVDSLPLPLPERWRAVPLEDLDLYAMPRLIHRYLESSNF